ncbi:MAG: butyryl-CoA dehydrogenase [Candidatus Sericytochromatia bacterium]|nr:MAG: butyryl-CoA dehydrogenase [Candidatus Sericytochromatia bacterium]
MHKYPMFLKEEHLILQETIRNFAEKEIKPLAYKVDEESYFPIENFKKLGEMGFLGVQLPEEYGGSGIDTLSYVICVEEIGRACGSTGLSYAAHISLGTTPFYLFGTEEQKKKYLPKLASGEWIGAWALTEPGAGSDAAGQKTTARREGDYYILSGSKNFITNALYGHTCIVMAMTDKEKGNRGISAFVVEKGTPGFKLGKLEHKMGMRGSPTSQLIFEDCKIPKENLLGQEGEGFIQALKTLDGGRISIGALALGIAQAAFDAALKYSNEREQFGKKISSFQSIQNYLADMATELHAARLMLYHAAWLKDNKLPYSKESAMAKLYASEVSSKVTNLALQIHGGYGYIKEYPVERYLRDAKLTEIGEGTSEVQRIVIARNLLKEVSSL